MNRYKKEIVLEGLAASPGIAIGQIFIHSELDVDLTHSGIEKEDIELQVSLFREAIEKTKDGLRQNIESTARAYGEEFSDVFLGQIALIEDDFFLKEVEDEININLVNAEAATFKIFSSKKDYFLKLDNEYFKDRAFDLHDLKKQIIYHIQGETKDYSSLSEPAIIVASHISPSDAVNYKRENILGFVTEVGGRTSHTAILSRSLSIPNISGIKNIHTLFEQKSTVIIDSLRSKVIVHPFDETLEFYKKEKEKYDTYIKHINTFAKKPSTLKDGTEISLSANIEFMEELEEIGKYRLNSIGLFRSEGYFLSHHSFPDEETQVTEYEKIDQYLETSSIVIRTLDIGGDKIHKKFENYKEDNPFLGWRAIRVSLDQIEMFQTQLRAILRASANRDIKIMLPMLTDVTEVRETKAIIKEIMNEFREKGIAFNEDIELGIMVETPASAILADQFAKEVDFFSIGTNDLVQYSLAVDRGNEKVSYLYQENHPAVLKLIKHVLDVAEKHGIWVSMCGEMAGEPRSFPVLLGMGLRRFSMTMQKSVTLKRMMTELTLQQCNELYEKVAKCDNYIEVNYLLETWMHRYFPDLYV